MAVAFSTVLFAACATTKQTPEQRYAAAKAAFDQTAKEFHLPSADAKGAERDRLLREAARGYEQVLSRFKDQPNWCAQALRSLGNVRAEQNRLDDAVKLFASVAKKFPAESWEVLSAWKSAGDLLWEAGKREQAKAFYRQLVERFDTADAPQVFKTIVRGSKVRLEN